MNRDRCSRIPLPDDRIWEGRTGARHRKFRVLVLTLTDAYREEAPCITELGGGEYCYLL